MKVAWYSSWRNDETGHQHHYHHPQAFCSRSQVAMTTVVCSACRHTVSKKNLARHRTSSQCLLWSLGRGDLSPAIRAVRASRNYRRRLTRGIRVFKAFLKDNLAIQRTPRRLQGLHDAFVPFCPRSGGIGVGGDVRAFWELTARAKRDPRVDFFPCWRNLLVLEIDCSLIN